MYAIFLELRKQLKKQKIIYKLLSWHNHIPIPASALVHPYSNQGVYYIYKARILCTLIFDESTVFHRKQDAPYI